MARLKPFRALRYDARRAGPLETLVAPPHDVVTPAERSRLLGESPYNVIRLIQPASPGDAARTLAEWRADGVLVRDAAPAAWLLEESFTGPDDRGRTRRALVARIRLEPYAAGAVLPHERTVPSQKATRLELLRAVRTKLTPVLLLHEGPPPPPAPARAPDLAVTFSGVASRLWRIGEDDDLAGALASVRGRTIIADGHHRYETALRFHEEQASEETAHVLAALVSRSDPGLVIFPTHRLVAGPVPALNGRFTVTALAGGASEGLARLEALPRNRAAFVLLRPDETLLAQAPRDGDPLAVLDTAAIAQLGLCPVRFTPSAAEAEDAVRTGRASAAFLVRAPTISQVEAVALAGETMPAKSTYFFPKLTSGILFSPLDE
ncbi:MAG: DUF1015 domain-containing protein [Thermoleophilia bacterium]|nr:DUF1015 domain-containing protein [Thermoleophilia bacterium]